MIRHNKLSVAIAAILAAGPVAQVYAQASPGSDEIEEVVVTGLRGSLEASMDIKREAVGVVDAISAEDIGKFPDTNLAESLQRITGVSIDRRNGEGAVLTARGFGPEFNLVTLNGRQMPTADAFGNGAALAGGVGAGNRSFNFANLSADGISGLEVYKTGKADMATGGIGATVNVKTYRPFDNDGLLLNVGAKGIYDTNVDAGDSITPELSGIFSYADDDKTWGVSLNASYQKRESSAAGSTVNDWHIQPWRSNLADNRGSAPLFVNNAGTVYGPNAGADDFVQATIVNAPKDGQLYGIPNDIRYHYSDRESERSNAQLTLQFSPADSMTLTADYTYALQELTEDRGDQTVWLQRNGFYFMEFDTNESVATPVLLKEHTGSAKDFGYEQQHREQKNDLSSFGFNMNWAVSDRVGVDVDYHNSKARSLPNDSVTGGGETSFSVAGKTRGNCQAFYPGAAAFGATPVCQTSENAWDQVFQFNNGLPIAGRTLFPNTAAMLAGTGGNSDVAFDAGSMGSQVLRVNYQGQETEIEQFRAGTSLDFEEGRFQFGLETRDMEMNSRSSAGYMALGDWGVGDAGTVPDMVGLMRQFSLTGGFDDFSPGGAPSGGWKGNANTLAQWAFANGYGNWSEEAATDGQLRYNPGFAANDIVEEKTTAFYAQITFRADVGDRAANLLVGARYESTDVTATSLMLPTKFLTWQDDNDFQQTQSGAIADTVTRTDTANYTNVLPNLDFDIEVFDSLKARASYSKTIARANYGQLTAAVDPNTPGGSTLNGFQATGTANNPGLLPLESTNLDFSLEWYFSENGYVSAGWFNKDIVNFIGQGVFDEPLVGLGGVNIKDQTAGPRAQAALAALGGSADDSALFTMMAMMENPAGFTDSNGVFWPGGAANYNGTNEQHVAFATRYDLVTRADDPDYVFAVQKPINNKEANIHGWEFGGQYFFGESGFGILANYTIVKGDVGFDDAGDPSVNQFALLGLSDSANAVLMYEKYGISARLAYNWRDEFLTQANQGQWRNPFYVGEYYQLDMSLGYTLNEHLSFALEGINITGEDVRWHGRSEKQLVRLEDQSPRYAIGARYKF
jgi:TonB-dependent receptor